MSLPIYPKYKSSGMEWLGNVPEHWKVRSLKHVVSTPITDGPHETPVFSDVGIPFVSAEAVAGGKIDFSKIRAHISLEDHHRYSAKYSPKRHDIYMVKSGATTGVTAIVDTDIEFNIWSPLAAIRCDHEIAHPLYILNFLRSRNFQEAVTLNWSFGTQQNIGMGVLGNLSVVLPPLEEQFAIATFLRFETAKIDALISEQEKLITLLAEKRQTTISHAVTKGLNPDVPMKDSGVEWLGEVPEHWRAARLKLLFEDVKAGPFGSALTKDMYVSSGYRVYGQEQVIPADFSIGDYYINQEKFDELQQYSIRPNDILISCVGTFGRIAIVPVGVEPGVINPRLIRIRVVGSVLPQYLTTVLRSSVVFEQFSLFSRGGTMDVISIGTLSEIIVTVPPNDEQRNIIAFLNAENSRVDELSAEALRGIALLKERRSALISAAVTGKIDVRQAVQQEQITIQEAA